MADEAGGAGGLAAVTVVAYAGTVRVRVGAPGEPVAATAIARDPRDAKAADVAAAVTVDRDGGRIVVRVREVPRQRRQPPLALDVRVPPGTDLAVVSDSAMTVTTGTLARFDGSSALGDLHVERVTGDATVRTSGGAVGFHDVGGSLTVRAGTGLVIVRYARGSAVIGTSSGDIDIWRADGAVSVQTGSGNARIGVPREAQVDLDAQTVGGRVWPVPATVPAGGQRRSTVRARSNTGDVRIVRADPPANALA